MLPLALRKRFKYINHFPALSIILIYLPLAMKFNSNLLLQLDYLVRIFVGIFALFFLNNNFLKKPTDYFIYIFSFFALGSYIFFGNNFTIAVQLTEHAKDNYFYFAENFRYFLAGLLLLTFPLLVLKYAKIFYFKSKNSIKTYSLKSIYLLAIFSFTFVSLAIWYSNYHIGFGINDSYIRRSHFKDQFVSKSFFAYAVSISSNLVAPLLAFFFYFSRKIMLIIPFFLALLIFGLLGTKATFAYILLSILLAYLAKNNKFNKLPTYFLNVFGVAFILGLLESYLFPHLLPIILDRMFVRPFISIGETISKYVDFVCTYHNFNVFSGLPYEHSISQLVGGIYSKSFANENTNTFIHAFASGGLILYIFSFCILFIMLRILDSSSRGNELKFAIYVSIFTAIILLEQFLFTSFLSSGLIILYLFFLVNHKTNKTSL